MTWDEDEGVTLIELVVSMTIMAVMMTMFTTAAIQMYQAANKTESLGTAQTQLNTVFLRLDKIVRYASWISDPTRDTGRETHSIKMAATVPVGGASAQRCFGLKLSSLRNTLWTASWDPDVTPPAAPTSSQWDAEPPTDAELRAGAQNRTVWTQIATDIDAPRDSVPFERIAADAVQNFDRMQLNLEATTGSSDSRTKTNTNVRFTALNTSLARPVTDLCPLR